MVIRESLRNLRKLEAVTSQHNVKANKKLINNIKTNISTLRRYNCRIEENEIENSGIMIDIETKIPYAIYIDWEEEKSKMKKEGKNITLEKFLDFYTEKVTREENAQYLRQNTGYEGKGNLQKPQNALLLHTRGGYIKNNVENTNNYVPRKTIQHNRVKGVSRGRPRNSGHCEDNGPQTWKEITPTEL